MKLREKSILSNDESPTTSNAPYGVPIYNLMALLERKRSHNEANHNEEQQQSQQSEAVGTGLQNSDKHYNLIQGSACKRRKKSSKVEAQLLSEKYRSQHFFDLLGNDDANRQILRWVTYWKSVVFGTNPTFNEYTDRLGRPLKKILLVNGPPGTGKTTAVHVIARQAGFDVLEINASDERGASVVKDRIASAVESHQVYSKRPTAIVADEVEGASEHGFLKALTRMLIEDAKALSSGEKSSSVKKGKKKPHALLLRPIIAICNDVWSPNLHNLRQHAEIVQFQRHPPNRLIKRLEQICIAEKLRFATRQLSEIAEQCDYDLRACLNALQFGSNNNASSYSRENVEHTDWTALVKQQFLYNKPATFQQLECCSDIDKLVTACFTAYVGTSYVDDLLKKPAAIGDYLAMSDNRFATDDMKALVADSFGRMFRSPGLAVQTSINGGSSAARNFGRPPSTYEVNRNTASIISTIRKHSTSAVKTSLSDRLSLMEYLPFVIRMTHPPTRTVLQSEDKDRIFLIAQVMKDFGINLRTERQENGTFAYRLDPPIELACIFGESNRAFASSGLYITRGQIKDAMKELEKHSSSSGATHNTQSQRNPAVSSTKISEKASKVSNKPALNFGNFFIKVPEVTATQAQQQADLQAKKVWVQFSEGFSNAVRKPISWTELLYL